MYARAGRALGTLGPLSPSRAPPAPACAAPPPSSVAPPPPAETSPPPPCASAPPRGCVTVRTRRASPAPRPRGAGAPPPRGGGAPGGGLRMVVTRGGEALTRRWLRAERWLHARTSSSRLFRSSSSLRFLSCSASHSSRYTFRAIMPRTAACMPAAPAKILRSRSDARGARTTPGWRCALRLMRAGRCTIVWRSSGGYVIPRASTSSIPRFRGPTCPTASF